MIGKNAYFNVFYNRYDRMVQLWLLQTSHPSSRPTMRVRGLDRTQETTGSNNRKSSPTGLFHHLTSTMKALKGAARLTRLSATWSPGLCTVHYINRDGKK